MLKAYIGSLVEILTQLQKTCGHKAKTLLGDSLSAFAKDRPTQQHDTWGAGLKRLRFDRFSIITREETFLFKETSCFLPQFALLKIVEAFSKADIDDNLGDAPVRNSWKICCKDNSRSTWSWKTMPYMEWALHMIYLNLGWSWRVIDHAGLTSLVSQKDFGGRTGDYFAICQSSMKLPLTDHQFSLDRSSKTETTAEDFTLRSEIEDILANITRRKARAGVLSSARRAWSQTWLDLSGW